MLYYYKVKYVLQKINFYFASIGMVFLMPLMLLSTTDVLLRGLFSYNLAGVRELTTYLMAVIILSGIAYTYQVRGHAAITFLLDRMPVIAKSITKILLGLLNIITVIFIIWGGWNLAMQSTVVSDVLRISSTPFRILVFIAGIALLIEVLIDLVDELIFIVSLRKSKSVQVNV